MTENNSISLFKTLGLKIKEQHKPVLESEKKFYLIQVQSLEILHPNFMKTQSRETDLQTEDKNSKPSSSTNPENTKQIWEGKITFQIGCRQSFTQLQLMEGDMKIAQNIEMQHFNKLNSNNKDQNKKGKANSKDKNKSNNKNVSKDKTSQKDKTNQKDKTQNYKIQSKETEDKKKTKESKTTEEEKRIEESKTVEEKKTIEDEAGKKIEENTAKEEKNQQNKKDKKLVKKFDHTFNTALNYKYNKQKQASKEDKSKQASKEDKSKQASKEDKSKQAFKEVLHLFPFEKEQVMAIRLEVVQNVNDEPKEYAREYGYALIPIVPFIKLPYMKHQLEVHMVSQNDKKQIKNINIAKLNISLHFMHNFKARVFVEVEKADLERNLAKIGQMHPIIQLFLRNFKYNTAVIDEGGIKPHWKSQKKGQFCYFNIPLDSVRDDLFVSLLWRNEILKDIIDDITATDYIVGEKQVDFQVQTIFKKGTNLKEFIKQAIKNAKDKMDKIQNQMKENKLPKKRTEKEKEARQQGKNQKEKFDQTTKDGTLKLKREDLLEKLKVKRFDLYREKLKQIQGNFIEELIRGVPTIDTQNWPEAFTQSYETKILDHFKAGYEQFKAQQQQKYYDMNDFKESTQKVKNTYREECNQELKKIDVTEQIKKVLRDVIRQVGILIDKNMKSIAIGLNYENMQAKNQAEKEKSAGVLYIRTFFLYEFQYPIVQKKTYPEEDTFF